MFEDIGLCVKTVASRMPDLANSLAYKSGGTLYGTLCFPVSSYLFRYQTNALSHYVI